MIASSAPEFLLRLALAAPLAAPLAMPELSEASRAEARALLLSFDAAWNERDLDGLMEPFSLSFNCELYGEIGREELRRVFAELMDDLTGTRATTTIEHLAGDESLLQAFVRRDFVPPDAGAPAPVRPTESVCHVLWLRREDGRLRIVGLEEFCPSGLRRVADGRYRSPVSTLTFDVPREFFVVPAPPAGFVLDHVLLRGHDLRVSIRVLLQRTCQSFEPAQAMDYDLERFLLDRPGAVIARRGSARLAGMEAERAEAMFEGLGCRLAADPGGGTGGEKMRMLRIYARPAPALLLALDAQAPVDSFAEVGARLDALLASLRFDLPAGHALADVLAERQDWRVLADGRFTHPRAGFRMIARPPLELAQFPASETLFRLRLRAPDGALPPVDVDGVELSDPAVRLEEWIAVDETALATLGRLDDARPVRREATEVSGRSAVGVARHVRGADGGFSHQYALYVENAGFLFVLRATCPLEPARARDAVRAAAAAIQLDDPE